MSNPEFEKFDAVMKKVMSVSHDELVRREKEWQKQRQRSKKKRAKTSPASRVSSDKG
jgi:hypothetical protein